MRTFIQLLFIICFISFASCTKTATNPNLVTKTNTNTNGNNTGNNGTGSTTPKTPDLTKNVKNISEMIVPDNFNFENNRLVNINLSLTTNTYGASHLVSVCDADPNSIFSVIAQGSIDINKPFASKISIPFTSNKVYVIHKYPNNTTNINTLIIDANNNVSFNYLNKTNNDIVINHSEITSNSTLISSLNKKGDDSDGDGIVNSLDSYPSDPDRAFNNYFPNDKDYATLMYEDLWPCKGDYDMNDLVLDVRHQLITNANNQIVDVKATYIVRANGGNQALAFCNVFPFTPSTITNIVGGTLENNPTQSVIQMFDNCAKLLGGMNTLTKLDKLPDQTVKLSFSLSNKPKLSDYAIGEYNPFVWVNITGKGRGYEIHLPGHESTSLVDTKLFKYADDNTEVAKNRYYLAKNNLPWGLMIPRSLKYCVELTMTDDGIIPDITQVYLRFAQWAQSGGKLYNDWYTEQTNYRNDKYIYNK